MSHLFNYLNGNEQALQLVRVPTPAQEQARLASRQHDALVQERKRLGGYALLLVVESRLRQLEELVAKKEL